MTPVDSRVENLGTPVRDTPSHAHRPVGKALTQQAFRMCSYACCRHAAVTNLDGYDLCRPHIPEHVLLMAEDRARASLPYRGQLRPCGSLGPVLAVLEPQEAVA